MNIKRAAVSTVAAGFIGCALLGSGVAAGTASAAPTQQPPGQSQQHQERTQQQQEALQEQQQRSQLQAQRQQQRELTVVRPNYRPFTYRGRYVVPRYNAVRHAWGFNYNGTFVRVVLAHR